MQHRREPTGGPLASIGGLLILAVILIGLFMAARLVFRLLAFLSPVLIIVALLADYRTVLGYGRWLAYLTQRNTLAGIAAILLTVLGFPLVAAFLAGKALLMRGARKAKQEHERRKRGELIDFEEIDSRPLDLKRLDKERPAPIKREEKRKDDKYDDLFL